MIEENWTNLVSMFFGQAQRLGGKPFLWAKKDDTYQSLSWSQTAERVSALARGLAGLGIGSGDRVALVLENRPEWLIAELAIMARGAIAVPAFTTNTVEDHLHIFSNSGAKAVIVSSRQLSERVIQAAHRAGSVEKVVGIEDLELSQASGVEPVSWDALIEAGREMPDVVAAEADKIASRDTAVIIYTSGTGGAPKGVMLHHGALLHNCRGAAEVLLELGLGAEVFLSFLPLSHAYEHLAGHFFPMFIGAEIYYAEGVEHLSQNMGEAHPTFMTAVPRLYEMMHGRILKDMKDASRLKQKLFWRAVELGRRKIEGPGLTGLGEKLSDRVLEILVRAKLRRRFGGRLKAMISGGAPLNHDIGLFFSALGLRLLQGYGQTESAPLISVNLPGKIKLDTVGPAIKETQVKIAEDGEILVKGELVMQGYWQNPQATKEAITDGWLHTGDVGRLDEDGFITITDRKKDIIVNSGGDTLSPQRVEGFLTLEPEIAQAMVYGDKRPHLVALVVPDRDFARDWAAESAKPDDLAQLIEDGDFIKLMRSAVDRVNTSLATVERVRRFVLTDREFTIENGLMTPSLKVRRHKINEIHEDRLKALYS